MRQQKYFFLLINKFYEERLSSVPSEKVNQKGEKAHI